MSRGGGAGKVYFVLYLAVVLELLIIIVERDEAEEGLLRKQRETMKIVESILSQLQSGAGTEGINTRPQDEITIPPAGIDLKAVMGADIKSFRRYIVEVGVTDVTNELKKKEGEADKDYQIRKKKLVKLANVQEIEYQVFFSSSQDPNNAPMFFTEDEIKKQGYNFTKFTTGQTITANDGSSWEFESFRILNLDEEETFTQMPKENLTMETIVPIYPFNMRKTTGPSFAPSGLPDDSVFFYSTSESSKGGGDLKKRSFIVNFQPPSKAGWYKLRFASRTNRILGVKSGAKPAEISDETTVNIGTVQLTVRDLKKVKKELNNKLEKWGLPSYEEFVKTGDLEGFDKSLKEAHSRVASAEDATDLHGKINLYGYICKLLAPGQSSNFEQNRGSIEFNVRVITPTPTQANPVITIAEGFACFDAIEPVIDFTISPYQGNNVVEGKVIDQGGSTVARVTFRGRDEVAGTTLPPRGGSREYYGYVDSKLEPGKYNVEITHRLTGKSDIKTIPLDVFKAGLSNEQVLRNLITFAATYGNNVTVNAEPNSGGKIKPNQFKTYLNTDVDQQRSPFTGYTVQLSEAIFMSSNMNNLNLRITWIQPNTGIETDIFPQQTFPIVQKPPKVNIADRSISISGQERKISVRISRIIADGSPLGDSPGSREKADVTVTLGKIDVGGIQGFDYIEGSGNVEKGEGGVYSVYFDITGKLPRGQDKLIGNIQIPISATAKNKLNGKISKPERKIVTVPVNYEPEKPGRTPGRRPPR
ncbi:MAG: hypothetical protein A2X61_14175 [Ignavibacteria bacterium GWB2_35_12]|nr:MAG: hypothetical protein A2X61_14175 [Ignavibacteria bacterium GWB2_35_12]OGU96213.1 MAG: hypothetical protein A2220_12515 [Ignavibacteria bacterium RIFOXYA2_FULL_35_10]OGV23176.1 MAG: hypothetical protein A2475_17505 [Ignavibacteria bacterium RIFOXYC2_FULL_35_21]